jgi:hypothetical protein
MKELKPNRRSTKEWEFNNNQHFLLTPIRLPSPKLGRGAGGEGNSRALLNSHS